MPQNFQLLNANRKNANHICQNVPVQTAADMAAEVVASLNGERTWIDSSLIFQYNHSKTYEAVSTKNEERSIMEFLA